MSKRIVFGLVAWLLGAATATAGSLLAVSLLGQGIGGGSSQQMTQDAVNRALASEASDSSPSDPSAASRTTRPGPRSSRLPKPSATATPDLPPAGATVTPAATSASPAPGGTVLTSKGGEVVASCQSTGAYLLSWYPLQGYEIDDVVRGPAADAWVTFESGNSVVRMVVTCSAGVPSATTSTRSGYG